MEVIDSCATSNGGCDHICRHGVGGPVCSCHRGYQLQADGRSCEGMLPCANIYFHILFASHFQLLFKMFSLNSIYFPMFASCKTGF